MHACWILVGQPWAALAYEILLYFLFLLTVVARCVLAAMDRVD